MHVTTFYNLPTCTYARTKGSRSMYLNFRARSTFQVPVCTVPSTMDRTSRYNKVDAVRLYALYRLNLLLLKGQRCDGTYKYTNHKSNKDSNH